MERYVSFQVLEDNEQKKWLCIRNEMFGSSESQTLGRTHGIIMEPSGLFWQYQYQKPIMVTLSNVMGENRVITNAPLKTRPYSNNVSVRRNYKIPISVKRPSPYELKQKSIKKTGLIFEEGQNLRNVQQTTRTIYGKKVTRENYMLHFHKLLWMEEQAAEENLKKHNLFGVTLKQNGDEYELHVPGLTEKRPSLLRGGSLFLKPQSCNIEFETIIKDILSNGVVKVSDIDQTFQSYYQKNTLFDVRFQMSRVFMEHMHTAVELVAERHTLLFPKAIEKRVNLRPINRWFNDMTRSNEEQRSAVQHILSRTSHPAPYMVFGPPGTGKTMTIVEAILQIVISNPENRVLVCVDSNTAADHIAMTLLKYSKQLNIDDFLIRLNSKSRVWNVMPAELQSASNGSSYSTTYSINNHALSTYRVVVTTLLHAAKYGSAQSQQLFKLQMTHLFIDEAAQATEPATLVPVCGLLAPHGLLVLAGDPMQLGPVCISQAAKNLGLGRSLMERLKEDYSDLYESNRSYITMLVKNFRSNPEILRLPNKLFYGNNLMPLAPLDPLSSCSVLGLPGGDKAVVFHGVDSTEQRMGNAPSYFNDRELDLMQIYLRALIEKYNVRPVDIGVIAPYIRQVYKMKGRLSQIGYNEIDVGSVEAFQGKEKRVILVSTVRANFDVKSGLGFLMDDKRFNVMLTRAKAKLIVIGNPSTLHRDTKWRNYMDLCKSLRCYFGQECAAMPLRFDRCYS